METLIIIELNRSLVINLFRKYKSQEFVLLKHNIIQESGKEIKSLDYNKVFSSTKTRNRKNFYKKPLKYFSVSSEVPQFSEIFQILKFKNIMNRLLFTKSLIVLLKYIKISKYESNENLFLIIGSYLQ
ncbi:hypothetical protein H8356DRAFT_1350331 [Neocallimastix lanati (nom. inval.)]|nr:hypothetical protein H8356DRAFT_1350331 [Neocallimastix sp. JGI-2020a]